MNRDEQVVRETDLALVKATRIYQAAPPWDRPQFGPQLQRAREHWATARYRLLFPDSIATQTDVQEARAIRTRVEEAADKQLLAQALLDLAGLLSKFAH